MKYWILLVFRLLPGLDKRIEKCDKIIERIALSPFGDTSAQYDEILSQMDKKSKLINLRVMYERLKDKLDKQVFFILCKYASGVPIREIAKSFSITPGALYKRMRKAIDNAVALLENDGYTEERMNKEYLGMPFISVAYARIKNR